MLEIVSKLDKMENKIQKMFLVPEIEASKNISRKGLC